MYSLLGLYNIIATLAWGFNRNVDKWKQTAPNEQAQYNKMYYIKLWTRIERGRYVSFLCFHIKITMQVNLIKVKYFSKRMVVLGHQRLVSKHSAQGPHLHQLRLWALFFGAPRLPFLLASPSFQSWTDNHMINFKR